jgi:hypothetical protein
MESGYITIVPSGFNEEGSSGILSQNNQHSPDSATSNTFTITHVFKKGGNVGVN